MSRFTVTVDGRSFDVEFISRIGSCITFSVAGEEYRVEVARAASAPVASKGKRSSPTPRQATAVDLRAPMPGIVSEVAVTSGLSVKAGDVLLVIEAMKMENPIKASIDGVIDQILVKKGQEVRAGTVLVTWRT